MRNYSAGSVVTKGMTRCPGLAAIVTLMLATASAQETANDAVDQKQPAEGSQPTSAESICLMVESAATANGLPIEFFARVIWQESRFHPGAVGPQTRSGDHAEGIAQFMPKTAAERQLLDPFDPVQALPKSAEFLQDLRKQFGNLGLAAAAYNAGPQRVRDWIAGKRAIPAETQRYVAAITGRSIEDWKAEPPGRDFIGGQAPDCRALMALLKQQPGPFVSELVRRVELGVARPWGVQLSAGFSREQALASFVNVVRRYSGVLSGSDPMIVRSTFRSRGTRAFYQVRIGSQTRADADALCVRIERAGGPCMVLRNPRG
jgi:Transglycosylase SLT domain/SPOR domain